VDRQLQRVRRFARILDHGLVDPLLGLVLPGVGDALGSLMGLYVVVIAVRRRVSPAVIARMLLNLGADALLGVIPVLGDVVDFAFHANERNVALLEARTARGGRATARDWLVLAAAIMSLAGAVALVCWAVVALVHAL